MSLTPELIALLSLVCGVVGGVLIRVVDKWLSRKQVDFRQDLQTVQEFRAQIKELQERQNFLEDQLSVWKDRYYKLVEELTQSKLDRDVLRKEVDLLQREVQRLMNGVK